VLAGRYKLEEVIGRGGMSTVYRAADSRLGRTVAVKILLAGLADQDPAYVARFEREARAAAALASSVVVGVYDSGVDDGAQFIVMEYVRGRSLAAILGDRKPLECNEAVRIGERVADALGAAHAAGIMHRDIKPANVMIAEDGTVKVLDFGIARVLDATTITHAASVIGTAAYMAPERAIGEPGDARADIYSLGCLLYAMLTGRPPFEADLPAALLHRQVNDRPRSPRELRAGIPPQLDALVLEMLSKSPARRPQTALEVRDRLAALAGTSGQTAPTLVLSRPRWWEQRGRARALAGAVALLALVAIAIASPGGGSPPASSTSKRSPARAVSTSATTPTTSQPVTATTPTQTPPPPPAKASPPGHKRKHGKPGKPGKAGKPGH
jgi:serine/threonine-protein kinase